MSDQLDNETQMARELNEVRKLRWRLRQANKMMGKQGDTIHNLRAELAEVRTLNSKLERGELRRLESLVRTVGESYHQVVEENIALAQRNEELRAAQQHVDA